MASKDTSLTVGEKRKLVQHEETIEKGLHSFVDVGRALIIIRDERLYTDVADKFEDYCKKRWGFTSSRARQLIDATHAVQVVQSVTNGNTPLNVNERQARVLAALPDEQTQANVWVKAVETAPKGSDGEPKVTAAHVKKVADEMAPKMSGGKPKPEPVAAKQPEPEPEGGYEPHEAEKPLGKIDAIFVRMMEQLGFAEKILGKPRLAGVQAGLDAGYKALQDVRKSLRRAK